ncbi:LIM/homeobox protein Lhx9-like isoform X2 [Macrobrachium rosenbergii]|uniref:LIM/homeobox protein Lhx9-like isoform X2 n=1 Tax=Macrobrachium rosenbergii TaxID=79674 RepID=UPI0034D3ECC5
MLDRQEDSVVQEEVICVGCGGRITERWFSKTQEGVWHSDCLRCWECHQPLEEKCFAKHGHLYCREDYFRIFGCGRCGRCGLDIAPQELVMRARHHVFHLHCFTCASCHVQLHKGDHFGMRDGAVYCRPHYELILQSEAEMETVGVAAEMVPGGEISHLDGYRYDQQGGGQNRTKRMRTSFKHHQLRTMKSYFNLNQNPDAKDLKQLAQKTGLSKRVLQVWFQNARAKWRRNMLKQEQERHIENKMKEPASLLGDLRPVDSMGPGITDLYSMSSGDEGSQSLQFTDMCQ